MDYSFSQNTAGIKPSAIREIFKYLSDPGIIPLSSGNPSFEAMPVERLRELAEETMRENPQAALQYSLTEGYTPLRDFMKAFLRGRYSLGADFDELIVTSGAQQAIDLAARAFCEPGDAVICEEPSFIGALNAFRATGARLVGVPLEDDGIAIDALGKALDDNPRVKLIYLIPNFQNPTGVTMSLEKRKAVYALAKERGVVIIEDNPYGELRFEGADVPCIKSMDTDGLVIYAGSFSKILSPGMRVGYVLAHRDIISKMVVVKQAADVHTNALAQLIALRFMQTCDFDAHIAALRSVYGRKGRLMISETQREFPARVKTVKPQGGMFMWFTLPPGFDGADFAARAITEAKVAVVPGSAFCTDVNAVSPSFRLNFSSPTDENIVNGVRLLGKLLREL